MTTPEDLQARAGEAAALMKAMSNPHRLLILCMLFPEPASYHCVLDKQRLKNVPVPNAEKIPAEPPRR